MRDGSPSAARALELLRDLQRTVRSYSLGLGNIDDGWQRIIAAEKQAREFIDEVDRA